MDVTSAERYAVVSCHVERALDDDVWKRFSRLQERRPGGFAVAALVRPADPAFGEDEERWAERARSAAARAPLGHHTHWSAPDHARPTSTGAEAGERVLVEGRRLRELGLAPTLFCGGGWYTDEGVAQACAELGYVDCTPRARRPSYLASGARWASLAEPRLVRLPAGARLRVVPTTHSLGDLARTLRSRAALPRLTHVYFHDTDLLDVRGRALVGVLLPLLARRARAVDLDVLAATVDSTGVDVAWADVERF
jgi:hypothetical protein